MSTLVGLCGRQGSGKTTLAELLVQEDGFCMVSVATPIKEMLLSLGLSHDEIYGSGKEEACDLLCGKTPRHAMRTLGTEWGRKQIGQSLWTNAWSKRVNTELGHGKVIVDDIRFDDEADVVKQLGVNPTLIDHRHDNAVELSASISMLRAHLGLP